MKRWLKFIVIGLIVVICLALGAGALAVAQSGGALRSAMMTTAGLVALGVLLLALGYIRDEGNSLSAETFLHDAGQALLLGAVLTFVFAIVGEEIDDEKALRDLRRDNQRQVRTDVGGRVFDGVDLEQSTLQGLELRSFSFNEANLRGADLSAANLTRAQLHRADLGEANLGFADLTRAVFIESNLRGADLSRAILRGTNFKGAVLDGANLSEVECDETTIWPADLDDPPECG